MITELKSQWIELASKYSDNQTTIISLWEEILKHYSSKNRHYHNLSHIQNMLLQAEAFKNKIEDFDILLFSIWYHDVIYKSTKKDNEEKSAFLAQKRLKFLNFEDKNPKTVQKLIISTKKHQIVLDENEDNAYLLDFDLSILGTNWKTYEIYIKQIRKEYKIYPDFMYKPGRKKVLLHFLERETLYFTEAFGSKFEKQARENLNKEIELL
jgi:predicted metal-dependent HD superfamily phosphohydrolase